VVGRPEPLVAAPPHGHLIVRVAGLQAGLEIPENRAALKSRYGVELKEPKYGLVVGTYENMDPAKVHEASRRLDRFEILDYDSLLQLYLAACNVLQPKSA
jgi:hypothetical protein